MKTQVTTSQFTHVHVRIEGSEDITSEPIPRARLIIRGEPGVGVEGNVRLQYGQQHLDMPLSDVEQAVAVLQSIRDAAVEMGAA